MVQRRKKNTPATRTRAKTDKKTVLSEEEQETLRMEAYQMMSLLEDSSLAMFSSDTSRCYLVDEFWMHKWEVYTGYQELLREQTVKDSFGQKRPL